MEELISFAWLGLALIFGKILRNQIFIFRKMFIPASILGGFFLLIIGPEVLGNLSNGYFRFFSENSVAIWSIFPGFLINIVFASLFLGKTLPNLKEVWNKAGSQVIFSHIVAWGQYVAGFAITALILVPLFKVEPMFGTLIEIGFIGGHGTAAGLGETFSNLGWHQGQDLALGVATVGVVMGIISGIILINWGVKKGHCKFLRNEKTKDHEMESASKEREAVENYLSEENTQDSGLSKKSLIKIESIEPLSFHLAYIGVAIGAGVVILSILKLFELIFLTPLGIPVLLGHIPLFPLAMIGGVIVEKLHHRFFNGSLDRMLILKIQGTALDFLIVSALASLALSAFANAWLPLLILITVGIVWTVGAFIFLAPLILKDYWFERGIGDFGQSLGVTATGLLLMRIVDPDSKSPALESFGYKQLLFEPFLGGGLFTAISVPFTHAFGLGPMLVITSVIFIFWIILGFVIKKINA